MDTRALIDYNKYTLGVAGATTFYIAQYVIPSATEHPAWLIKLALFALAIAFVFGALVFSTSVSMSHRQVSQQSTDSTQEKAIAWFGTLHGLALLVALWATAALIYQKLENVINKSGAMPVYEVSITGDNNAKIALEKMKYDCAKPLHPIKVTVNGTEVPCN